MPYLPLQPFVARTIQHSPVARHRSMSSSTRWLGNWFQRSASLQRQIHSNGFKLLNGNEKVEEENWSWYSTDAYYPVQIGEVFQSRYQVLGKLGYGAHSTAWLGRDLQTHEYTTLKVCEHDSSSARREVAAYKHLDSISTSHSGALLIRQPYDSFKIEGRRGEHLCLVLEPVGMSIETFRELMPEERLSEEVLKAVLKHLLLALDFLHSEARMIHTDLQAMNMHFRIVDDSILKNFEEEETDNPSPRKIDGDRVIYESREFGVPNKLGPPVLCDFGEARYGKAAYTDDIQPHVYRAPEVILNMPWSNEVDIWNVGVMIWDLFENRHLFSARGPNGNRRSEYHLAEMVAILGPPPPEFLQRTKTSWEYFETNGTWKASASIPDISLEGSEERLQGVDKALFLEFIRKMLQWAPEERHTAKQLLEDPWLKK